MTERFVELERANARLTAELNVAMVELNEAGLRIDELETELAESRELVRQLTPEQWKKIDDFPDYSVSDHGRVRNDATGRIKKPFRRGFNNEYLGVDLYRDQRRHACKIHRLVATAFLPDHDPSRNEVNHLDCDPTNNQVSNLQWCTRQENEAHKEFMQYTEIQSRIDAEAIA